MIEDRKYARLAGFGAASTIFRGTAMNKMPWLPGAMRMRAWRDRGMKVLV
jgi:hypothetical protein